MTSRLLSSASILALGLMISTSGTAKADAMHDAAVWEFYLGAHGGLGMLDGKTGDIFGDSYKLKNGNRGVFGGLAGVNLRLGYWLFGLEGDFGLYTKSRLGGVHCNGGFSCKVPMNYHVRGRLGYMMSPNVDVFAAVGLALLDLKYDSSVNIHNKTLSGLSLGAGADIKLGQIAGGLNPVLRIEALYDMYGKKNMGDSYTAKNWDEFTARAAAMFSF